MSEKPTKDAWEKLDVIIKALGVVFISGAVTFYAIYSENKRAETQLSVSQETNRFRLYAEAMGGRLSTEARLKSDLIDPLLQLFITHGRVDDSVTALELLAHNFHEQFDLKPLFRKIDADLGEMRTDVGNRLRPRLQRLAAEIRDLQSERLVLDGAIREQIAINLDESAKVQIGEGWGVAELLSWNENDREARLRITFSTQSSNEAILAPPPVETVVEPRLGPYNFPFVDYYTIGGQRYAFLLLDARSSQILVAMIVYPRDYFEIQDRIQVNRLLQLPVEQL